MIHETPGAVPPSLTFDPQRIPGNRGIWVGIFCVLVEFGLMFLVYFIARAHHPEAFVAGPQRLSTLSGAANTAVLLTSGWFAVKAVDAIRRDDARRALRWLLITFAAGLGYPIVKFFEIRWNLAHGIDGNAGIFFTVYYYLTLNHLVHACWGLLGLGWVIARTRLGYYSAAEHGGLEAAAVYWHTTDLIWLIIFPLLYVLR